MTGYIYKIINRINGYFYIGSTTNINRRKWQHMYHLERGDHHCQKLQHAVNKYGIDNFYSIVREIQIQNEQDLRALEERYIRFCWSSKKLYNVSKNGSGGDVISYHPNLEAIKLKHSIIGKKWFNSLTEEQKRAYSEKYKGKKNPNYGNHWNKEQREKASINKKEYFKTHTNAYQGKTLEEVWGYEKAKEIKQKISKTRLKWVKEKKPFFGKHHSAETKNMLHEKNKGKQPINCKRVLYQNVEYSSAHEAAKKLGLKMVTVAYRCRQKIMGFSYIKEDEHKPLSLSDILLLAKKYDSYMDFRVKEKSAYYRAKRQHWLEEIKDRIFR